MIANPLIKKPFFQLYGGFKMAKRKATKKQATKKKPAKKKK